jgi:excinuclease ABC subunit C
MLDARGDVLYVGKAKNIKKRVAAYARPTGLDTRIERMIAATRCSRFH